MNWYKPGGDVCGENNHSIKCASRNGYTEIVKLLIQANADVHANDNYAIKWAYWCGKNIDTIRRKYSYSK